MAASWQKSALVAAAACWAATAHAYIPPEPFPELAWSGPGMLCEATFSFRALENEIVVANPQLELWQPVSNTVKTPHGWFSIAQINFDKLTRRRVGPLVRRSRATRTPAGSVYRLNLSNPAFTEQYAFVPRGRSQPSLLIDFYRPGRDGNDWRKQPPPVSLTAPMQRAVFDRIAPPQPKGPGCLNQSAKAKDTQ